MVLVWQITDESPNLSQTSTALYDIYYSYGIISVNVMLHYMKETIVTAVFIYAGHSIIEVFSVRRNKCFLSEYFYQDTVKVFCLTKEVTLIILQ